MRQYTKEIIKKFVPNGLLVYLRTVQAREKIKQGPRKRKLLRFELHIADHCNLNCRSCSHFSPLVKEKFLEVNSFRRDCERLASLTGGRLEGIRFMGGEPLLHPRLTEIMNIVRSYFNVANLDIVTNGILLLKQDDDFWENCRKNKVQIHISNYPIQLDRAEIQRIAASHNVKIVYMGDMGKWWAMRLDPKGLQNVEEAFRLCGQSNQCIQLYDGKLYTCPTIAYINHLNHYFNQNFQVSENDYVDIYKINSADEILEFLCSPPPFCRYCNIRGQEHVAWGNSEKKLSEWVMEDKG